jgi:hypothetical protein
MALCIRNEVLDLVSGSYDFIGTESYSLCISTPELVFGESQLESQLESFWPNSPSFELNSSWVRVWSRV